MAKALILKSFPYSANGVASKVLTKGSVEDIRDDLCEGLAEAGYIGRPPPEGEQPPQPPEGEPAPQFNPETSDLEEVKAFLTARGIAIPAKAGEAKLRELAAQAAGE